jgi:hypothetical protein
VVIELLTANAKVPTVLGLNFSILRYNAILGEADEAVLRKKIKTEKIPLKIL